jgi:5-carboxymethyl-2-hydroxymuconate isomerase
MTESGNIKREKNMPHIVVEYSDNLANEIKSSKITALLHKAVVDSGLFAPDAVKARSIGYSDYVLTGDIKSFVHVTVSILGGRTVEQRKALNDSIFELVGKTIPNAEKVSADIREMDGAIYRK